LSASTDKLISSLSHQQCCIILHYLW